MHNEEQVREILDDIYIEVNRQEGLWGIQTHPDGTGSITYKGMANKYRDKCEARFKDGKGTYLDILLEEVFEAAAEPERSQTLIDELVQVAAVCTSWIRKIKEYS